MKSRLHKIEIRNFKAFREFNLNLEGRHLLVYGDNGAGKSSLYWALYTFLQSARKPKHSISKYFDPAGPEHLLNLHESDPSNNPGKIALTLREHTTGRDTTYRISHTAHETHDHPIIVKGDLASDFVTYRFFFGFSHFRNSDSFDLWPLFLREILPFCVTRGGMPGELEERWNTLKLEQPNPNQYRGTAGAKAFREFNKKLSNYTSSLKPVVDDISSAAQVFYDTNFSQNDTAKITLKLAITQDAYYSQEHGIKLPPVLRFGIQANGIEVKKPQSFMNEAKMTQLALSIRFAASLVNLHESDLKLLVLDDLLVSLDMSNRMKVVEILLSETFANYQKIILTHDLGFFREFRRTIGASHPDWMFARLQGTPATTITPTIEKTELQRAEDYLHGHHLDEAATCLRKAAEDMAKRYREWLEQKKLPPGEFFSLTENLRVAKNKLLEKIPAQLYGKVIKGTPAAHRDHLVPATDADIDALGTLDASDRGRLKTARRNLRALLKDENWRVMENIRLIDEVLGTTERVLNPGAHGGDAPLYEHEIQKALDLISRLERCLA